MTSRMLKIAERENFTISSFATYRSSCSISFLNKLFNVFIIISRGRALMASNIIFCLMIYPHGEFNFCTNELPLKNRDDKCDELIRAYKIIFEKSTMHDKIIVSHGNFLSSRQINSENLNWIIFRSISTTMSKFL